MGGNDGKENGNFNPQTPKLPKTQATESRPFNAARNYRSLRAVPADPVFLSEEGLCSSSVGAQNVRVIEMSAKLACFPLQQLCSP